MTQPTVCAILLTADRPEMARRAAESFRSQTYPAKRLLVYDTGAEDVEMDWLGDEDDSRHLEIEVLEAAGIDHHGTRKTIGYLRNRANAAAAERDADILIHFDDDDWSHPNRIADQVALLQSSGADCVGFREMLFWREDSSAECICPDEPCPHNTPGEAWLYTNPDPRYALGTSLCYWRKTWERKPFEALPTSAPGSASEDARFITGLNCVGISGTAARIEDASNLPAGEECAQPRMVARIHAGNTSQAYDPRNMERSNRVKGGTWRRVPEWDWYCGWVMRGISPLQRWRDMGFGNH